MKKKFLKLLGVVALIAVCVGVFVVVKKNNAEADTPSTLEYVYKSQDAVPFTNNSLGYDTHYREVTLGGEPGYCVDYGRALPTSTGRGNLSFKRNLSNKALTVLVYGFPNNIGDVESFGISKDRSSEVAYLATQMAFWEILTRTGEMEHGLSFNMKDIVAKSGYEDVFNEMKTAANKLVELAENSTFIPNPEISLDTSGYTIDEVGDKIVAGPYRILGNGADGSADKYTIEEIKASLVNAPSTATVTDRNGSAKNTFSVKEPFYVTAKKSDTAANFTLNVDVTCQTLVCAAYGDSNSSTQDFATITKENVVKSQSVNVTWKKDTGNIRIIKEDEDGKKINGVVFEVTDGSDNKIAEVTTDSTGQVDLLNLPTGKYVITEKSAPANYVVDPKPKSIVLSSGSTENVVFLNLRMTGKLELTKKDTNNDPVANVKFNIYDVGGNFVETIITNSKGVATSSALPIGRYTYREMEVPDNLVLNTKPITFTFGHYGQVISQTVINELVKGSLKITKQDEEGNPISGVKFDILDSSKNKIETITTDASGVAVAKTLSPGTYYYKETKVPSDYVLDDEEKEFTVENASDPVARKVENRFKKGSLKIIKVDQSGNPIAGVTFEIYDSSKNKVDTIVTDTSGIARSNVSLKLGKYSCKEVSAPANVKMDTEEHEFTLKTDGQVVELSLNNTVIRGQIKILKTDTNGKAIEGAVFEILDSSKNVVETITTDANGVAVSSTLGNGTYYYREKSVPDAYVLDTTEVEFKIASADDFIEKTVVNKFKSAKFIVHKLNKDTNEPIENVRFEILDASNNIVASAVTDSNGYAETTNLPAGTYYYKEVSVPDNISADLNTYDFKIEGDGTNVEKTIYNIAKRLPVTGSFFNTDVIIVIVITVSCIVLYIVIKMVVAFVSNRR